ncbi:MAG: Pre-mRNA-splicing factor cef1 [Chaenotheca gracillima]|nr:MAG: Pre-mRNA-splicing factor cef1 [Chaenotheca gracillima]
MGFAGAILESSRCNGCRLSMIRTFLSSTTLSPPRQAAYRSWSHRSTHPIRAQSTPQHCFSTQIARRTDQSSILAGQAKSDGKDDPLIEEYENDEASTLEQAAEKPWYLDIADQTFENPIAERQRLPETPSDSPEILNPLLQHLSVDLGIDDLRLLDLRQLDPPPALGAKLMMLIGTTRSEKHLHVSADRLRHWARTHYNLNPVADGLLGKNEIKLKLRRRAKRAKLLGSSGSKASRSSDDGITTGWVCVNLGAVKQDHVAAPPVPRSGFVGFGEQDTKTRLVVQLLTEEKRAEMDLETLWSDQMKRYYRQQATAKSQTSDSGAREPNAENPDNATESTTIRSSQSHSPPNVYNWNPQIPQARRFHTLSSYSNQAVTVEAPTPVDVSQITGAPESSFVDEIDRVNDDARILLSQATATGDYQSLRRLLRSLSFSDLNSAELKALTLAADVAYLKSLPRDEALRLLGTGGEDYNSTPFLFSFYQSFPISPLLKHWRSRLELLCYAAQIGHSGFATGHLLQLLEQIEVSVTAIPEDVFISVLRTVARRSSAERSTDGMTWPCSAHVEIVSNVIEKMHLWGHNVLSEEVFLNLHEIIGAKKPAKDLKHGSSHSYTESSKYPILDSVRDAQRRQTRLETIMRYFDVHFTTDESITRMLTLYANQGRWDAFWGVWSMPSNRMLPRSATLYTSLFQLMARTKTQVECIHVLRKWVPEMKREEPPVELEGDLARAVMACLKIAQEDVETQVAQDLAPGEWRLLWRRCQEGLI